MLRDHGIIDFSPRCFLRRCCSSPERDKVSSFRSLLEGISRLYGEYQTRLSTSEGGDKRKANEQKCKEPERPLCANAIQMPDIDKLPAFQVIHEPRQKMSSEERKYEKCREREKIRYSCRRRAKTVSARRWRKSPLLKICGKLCGRGASQSECQSVGARGKIWREKRSSGNE